MAFSSPRALIAFTFMFTAATLIPEAAQAVVESGVVTGGQSLAQGARFVKLEPPFAESTPANTVGADTFQSPNLFAFDEDQNIELTADLTVDLIRESGAPGVLPAGSTVASHYVFFDPAPSTSQTGEIRFDSDIVAVITSTNNLQASDFLANTGVVYQNPSLRGLEPADDSVAFVDARTLSVNWSASTPGDYIRVLTRFSPGAAECAVEVVFAVDTSGSMNDDIGALCQNISAVEDQLRAQGIDAQTHLLGITSTRNCLTSTVAREVGSTVPGNNGACGNSLNQVESWGQATASLARNFPWQPGATRVVIPISDEGPCDGGGGPDFGSINQADRDAITNAIEQAQRAGVVVSPITASGTDADMFALADQLATATGGEAVRSTDPDLDIPAFVAALVEDACSTDICAVIDQLDDTARPVSLRPISTTFNGIIGIDYYELTDGLVVSTNYPTGQPTNFELIDPDGNRQLFGNLSGLTDEVKLASARSTQTGGYSDGDDIPAGTFFSGTGVDGELLRVGPDRTDLRIATGASGLFRGSLYVDRTGVFDGDLIAVSTGGTVLRMNNANEVQIIAQLGVRLEGVVVVPNDSSYGAFAGRILAGDETTGALYAIAADGSVDAYPNIGVDIEDIDLIPEGENFYGANFGTGQLLGAESIQWIGYDGGILLTQEFPAPGTSGLYVLTWDNGPAVTPVELSGESFTPGQWEHVTFAPAGVLELPVPPVCSLAGDPDLTVSKPVVDASACPGTLTISAQVGNVGLGTAGQGSLVNLAADGIALGSLPLPRDLAPGEFESVLLTTDDFLPFEQELSVTADADDTVVEIDEGNNTATVTAGLCTSECIQNFSVRVKRTKAQLTWSPVVDASFEIQRGPSMSGPWTKLTDTTSTYATYLDETPPTAQPVYYRIIRTPGELGEETCISDTIATYVPGGRSRLRLQAVPDLTGLTQAEASAAVTGSGFVVGTVDAVATGDAEDGRVFAQDPPIGSALPGGSSVAFTLAINPLPVNTPPVIAAFEQVAVDEGSDFLLRGSFTDPDDDQWQASVDFGDGQPFSSVFVPADKRFVASRRFGDDGSFTGLFEVSDDKGASDQRTFDIVVRNVTPVVFAGSNENVTRDVAFVRDAFFTDPGTDSWTGFVSWGDGSAEESLALAANKTFTLAHTFTAEGVFTVTVRVLDDEGAEGTSTFSVRVQRPTVTVPNVVGSDVAAATSTLTGAGLELGTQVERESKTVPAGEIFAQSPAAGASVSEGVPVTVTVSIGNQNEQPSITSTPPTLAVEAQGYQYSVTATDPDDDTLSFALAEAPAGMSIDASGLVSWLPNATQVGRVTATVVVTDGFGGEARQAFAISVKPNIVVDVPSVEGLTRGETERLLTDLGLVVGPVTNVVDTSVPPGTVIGTSVPPGTPLQAGSTVSLTVAVSALRDRPAVSLTSPTSGTTLTALAPVVGTIEPATEGTAAQSEISWQLRLTRSNDPEGRLIGEGAGAAFGERLAEVDPTLLANDAYQLVLRYQQGPFAGSTSLSFDVEGELKLGNFRIDFTDVSIDYNGLPIVIAREYDTVDLAKDDFGFGWRLSTPGEVRDGAKEGQAFVRGTKVYVTLPGGERLGFRFDPQPLSFLFPWISAVRFQPDPGVSGTLEAVGAGSVFSFGGLYTNLIFPYNPRLYRYTARDGTQFVIDEFDGLQSAVDSNGNTLFYTSAGIVDSNGNGVTFLRDAENRISGVVTPDGTSVSYGYDNNGDLVAVTDENAVVTNLEYNAGLPHYLSRITRDGELLIQPVFSEAEGRLVAVCSGDANPVTLDGCTQMTFDPENRSQRLIEPGNRTIDVVYDEQGNVTRETVFLEGGEQLIDSFAYDERGNQTRIQDSGGYTVDVAYDGNNNPNRIEMLGVVGEFTHNSCGQMTSFSNNGVLRYSYEYDATGCNLTRIIDASGTVIENQYDANGRLSTVQDPLGNTTSLAYDANGNVDFATDPLGAVADFAYNSAGRLESKTDRNGRTIEYSYDAKGNLLRERWIGSSPAVQFDYSYDGNDRLLSLDGPQASVTFAYDADGEKQAVTTTRKLVAPGSHTVSYEYDGVGNLSRIVDGAGGELRFERDAGDRPTRTIQQGLRDRSVTFEFDGSHVLRRMNYFSDVDGTTLIGASEFDYDCPGCAERPSAIRHFDASGAVVASYSFTLNDLHDVTGAVTERGTESYSYDARRQLTAVDRSFASAIAPERYSYDAAGNRTSSHFAGDHTLLDPTADSANRIGANDLYRYEYDGEGNMTARIAVADDTRTEYSYDYRNRLVRVEDVASGGARTLIAEYVYDGLNRRIAKRTTAATRIYLHEGQNVIAETDAAGAVLVRRFYEPSMPDGLIAQEFPGGDRWLLTDQVGSARHTLDEAGALADTFAMSAYGRIPSTATSTLMAPVFAALEYEPDVQLYHADARYYDPELGRFRKEDPIGFVSGDANLYRYGENNPYRFTDPSGRATYSYAQINRRIAVFQRRALQCLGNGVFTTAGEVGVYLIIEAVGLKYSRSGPANVYLGRTRNKGGFGVRFYQHKRKGRQIVGHVTFPVSQHIINNPKAFAELEQLLLDAFGGKAQTTNKINAVSPKKKKIYCP